MGIGSIFKVKTSDQGVQIPSIPSTKRSSLSSAVSTRKLRSQQATLPEIQLPPTPPIEEEYRVKRNAEQYSQVWDQNIQLSPGFRRILKAEFDKAQHHQKETIDTSWTKNNSVDLDTAHVESSFLRQSHSCINLSSSEKIDEMIRNLTRIHTQLDETIRRRTEQISVETESVLAQIINETQEEQQRLLKYAKIRQTKQEEEYRKQLQIYIDQLDRIKAQEIAQLQEELQQCREQILQTSQIKIMAVNEQANLAKSKIVQLEQQQASMKIETINLQLQKLASDKTFQHLGTETKSRTSLTSTSRVGTKSLGQNCSFELIEDIPPENNSNEQKSKTSVSKVTYSTIEQENHSHSQENGKNTH